MPIPMIVDTDTASDDAVALIMALREPEVDVKAITIVAGNVPMEKGSRNARYTVELCEAGVPVFSSSGVTSGPRGFGYVIYVNPSEIDRATAAGPADSIVCGLVEGGYRGRIKSVRSADTYIPLGAAAEIVLMDEEQIVKGAQEVLR